MKKYYADKKSLNFLRVTILIILIVIIIGLKYLSYFLSNKYSDFFSHIKFDLPQIVLWGIAILLMLSYIIVMLFTLPLWYKSLCYVVTSEDITINAGIFIKNKHYMKISSIQYTTAVSMPFSKYTSFNFLIINAHGGRLACMFLSMNDIKEMSARIQKYLKSYGGLE